MWRRLERPGGYGYLSDAWLWVYIVNYVSYFDAIKSLPFLSEVEYDWNGYKINSIVFVLYGSYLKGGNVKVVQKFQKVIFVCF